MNKIYFRRGGRADEGAALEKRYALLGYQGFESLPLRQLKCELYR